MEYLGTQICQHCLSCKTFVTCECDCISRNICSYGNITQSSSFVNKDTGCQIFASHSWNTSKQAPDGRSWPSLGLIPWDELTIVLTMVFRSQGGCSELSPQAPYVTPWGLSACAFWEAGNMEVEILECQSQSKAMHRSRKIFQYLPCIFPSSSWPNVSGVFSTFSLPFPVFLLPFACGPFPALSLLSVPWSEQGSFWSCSRLTDPSAEFSTIDSVVLFLVSMAPHYPGFPLISLATLFWGLLFRLVFLWPQKLSAGCPLRVSYNLCFFPHTSHTRPERSHGTRGFCSVLCASDLRTPLWAVDSLHGLSHWYLPTVSQRHWNSKCPGPNAHFPPNMGLLGSTIHSMFEELGAQRWQVLLLLSTSSSWASLVYCIF